MLRAFTLVLLGLAAGPALAGNFGGSDSPTRIPVPARPFDATIEDLSGTTIEVTRVTFDGEVYIQGLLGEGSVSVPFEKVKELRIEPTGNPGKRIAFVMLHDGSSVRLVVDADKPCYGATSFGYYRVPVEKVRRVLIRPAAPPSPPTP